MGLEDLENIFEEKDTEAGTSPDTKERRAESVANIFDDKGEPKSSFVKKETGRKLDQFGLPKAEIRASDPKEFSTKDDGIFTKMAKLVLPKNLEKKFGLTEPESVAEAMVVQEGARQNYWRQKRAEKRIEENLAEKGMTREDIKMPEDYKEPGTLGQVKEGITQTWYQMLSGFGGTLESVGGKIDPRLREAGEKFADKNKTILLEHPEWMRPEGLEFQKGGWKDPRWYGRTVGELIPSLFGALAATTVGGLAGGAPGAATGFSSFAFNLEKGTAYNEMIEKGISPENADLGSNAYGAIATALEGINFIRVGSKILKGAPLQSLKDGYKRDLLVEIPKTVGIEATTEGSQELAQNLVTKFFDKNQSLMENVVEATAAGGVGGLGFGGTQIGFKAATRGKGIAAGEDVTVSQEETQVGKPPEGEDQTGTGIEVEGEQGVGIEGEQETGVEPTTGGDRLRSVVDIFGTKEPTQKQVQKKSADLRKELDKVESRISELDKNGVANLTAEQQQERRQSIERSSELRSVFTEYLDATKEKTAELKQTGKDKRSLYKIEVAQFSDGKFSFSYNVNLQTGGIGAPFQTKTTELANSRQEATELAAIEIRDWARQQLQRKDAKGREGQQLQQIINDVEGNITDETKSIEETDFAEANETLNEMVENLFTAEEAFERTASHLDERWSEAMGFFQDNIELPAFEEIRKIDERLASLKKTKENREYRKRLENRKKTLRSEVENTERTITAENEAFQDELAGIVLATAQEAGVDITYDPNKSFENQSEQAIEFAEEFLRAVYERPGVEVYWNEKLQDVLNIFIERSNGNRVQNITRPEDVRVKDEEIGTQEEEAQATEEVTTTEEGGRATDGLVEGQEERGVTEERSRFETAQDLLREVGRPRMGEQGLNINRAEARQLIEYLSSLEGEKAAERGIVTKPYGAKGNEVDIILGETGFERGRLEGGKVVIEATRNEDGTYKLKNRLRVHATPLNEDAVIERLTTSELLSLPESQQRQEVTATEEEQVGTQEEQVVEPERTKTKKPTKKKQTKRAKKDQAGQAPRKKKQKPTDVVKKIREARPSIPVLKNAFVQNGRLRVTDLDVSVDMPTKLADGFYQVVGKDLVPNRSADADLAEFPSAMELSQGKKVAKTDAVNLASELDAANTHILKRPTKPELEGVYIEMKKGAIEIASTDQFRLYRREISADTGGNRGSFIIGKPQKVASALSMLEGDINIRRGENNLVQFTDGETNIFTREIEGDYPRYSAIYPSYQTQYSVNKKALADAIKDLKPLVGKDKEMAVYTDGNDMVIKTYNEALDAGKEVRVPFDVKRIETTAGEAIDGVMVMPIRAKDSVVKDRPDTAGIFNLTFLEDATKSFAGEELYLKTTSDQVGVFNQEKPLHISDLSIEKAKTIPQKERKSEPEAPVGFALKDIPEQSRDEAQETAAKDIQEVSENVNSIEREQGGDTRKSVTPRAKKETGGLDFNIRNLFEGLRTRKGKKESDKVVRRSEIARMLSKKLRVPIRRGRFRNRALGVFKPDANIIRILEKGASQRHGGEIATIFHEIGHFIDYSVFEFREAIPKQELEPLTQDYGGALRTPKRLKEEAFAEFLRFYLTDARNVDNIAPRFKRTFEEKMEQMPEIFDVLKAAKKDFKRWADQPATAKVMSQISYGDVKDTEIGERVKERAHLLYEQVKDDLHPIRRFSQKAKENLGAVEAENDPYVLARLLKGWTGKADMFLRFGTIDKKYWEKDESGKLRIKTKGKSLDKILAPAEKKGALEELSTYLVSKRAVELANRRTEKGKPIATGIAKEDAEAAVKELESRFPEFKTIQKELVEYQDQLLEYGWQNGLYDKNAMGKIKSLNRDYVPFYRVQEELKAGGFFGKGIANVRNPIKRIKGSEREIIDPLESIVKNTYTLVNAAERNNVMMSFVNLSQQSPELGQMFEKIPQSQARVASVKGQDIIDKAVGNEQMRALKYSIETQQALDEVSDQMIDIFRPSFFEKGNVVTVLVNGKPQAFELHPDLYRSVNSLERSEVGAIVDLLSYPAKFLRAGAVLSPDFMIRNPLRDQLSAYIYSKYGITPLVDFTRGVWSMFAKDDAYLAWKTGGGEMATIVDMDRKYLSKSVKEITSMQERAKNVVKNPLKLLQLISQLSEQGTRIGEAKRGLAQGQNPIEIAFASREVTLDFLRIGGKTQAVNRLAAFFNTNLEGTDKMIRTWAKHPFRTAIRTFNAITLPSILLYLANRDEEGWDEIPRWQKDLFWLVKIGDTWWRVPKPFELGIIFGSTPERILEYIDTKDPDTLEELKKTLVQYMTPNMLPTGLTPVFENLTNYSFFLDRPIVPVAKQHLPKEDQYTNSTSEVSKISGQLLNMSPAKIENLLQGYFAGLGQYALDITDGVLKGTGITNPVVEPEKTLADQPVIKSLVVREPIGSAGQSVDSFYKEREKATKARNKYNLLLEEGDREKAKQYLQENPEAKLYSMYNKVATKLGEIRKARQKVLDSKVLTAKQKREKIRTLDQLQTTYAHRAINIELKE